jgi:hypothetical protein
MTPDRAGSRGGVSTDLKLRAQQILEPFLVYRNQYQVRCLAANLKAETSSREAYKHWSTPTALGSAGHNSLTVGCAYDESALFHAGYDRDAGGFAHNSVGYASIRSLFDLSNDLSGSVKAILQ